MGGACSPRRIREMEICPLGKIQCHPSNTGTKGENVRKEEKRENGMISNILANKFNNFNTRCFKIILKCDVLKILLIY